MSSSSRYRLDHFASIVWLATLLLGPPGVRHAAAQEALWVGRLGTDTVVVEGARQVGSWIEGTIVNVAAGLTVQRYEADLDPDGNVRSLRRWAVTDLTAELPPDAAPTISVEIGSDSIRVTRAGREGTEVTTVPAVKGAVPIFDPFFNNPMALMDLALRAAGRRSDGIVRLYYVGSPNVDELPLQRTGSGEVSYPYALARQYPMMAGARLHATVDDDGMRQFDARETTLKIVTQRGPWSDPLALARQFERRGLGAGGIAGMSPPREASGHIGTVNVNVTYGQPSRRGRRIFPDVVPFGTVWRAGANAATELSFSADVIVEGDPVPAGSYSVWVIPGENADTLILNKATQIWGTMYDAEQDLVRIPMRTERVADPIEHLTFSIMQEAGAGRLELAWGDRRLSVSVEPADQAQTN